MNIVYVAYDGTHFDTAEECEYYESYYRNLLKMYDMAGNPVDDANAADVVYLEEWMCKYAFNDMIATGNGIEGADEGIYMRLGDEFVHIPWTNYARFVMDAKANSYNNFQFDFVLARSMFEPDSDEDLLTEFYCDESDEGHVRRLVELMEYDMDNRILVRVGNDDEQEEEEV